jgi:phosphoadenosine phosphosulfate reductase
MLIEHTLFGDVDKVQVAIERLRTFEPPEGYYLAFSGGKDSITIYHLAEMAGVKFDAHFNLTSVDPPEVVRFVREYYPTVMRHTPPMTMWRLILKHKCPPLRQRRYCCEELKERGGDGRFILTGVRWAESARRKATRKMVETCYKGRSKRYLHPIIDWTDDNVWDFIRSEHISYCSLYDEGFDRIGCILCPMQAKGNVQRDIDRWPRYADKYIRTFDELIALRHSEGKKVLQSTGQELFEWWIRRRDKPASDEQPALFI